MGETRMCPILTAARDVAVAVVATRADAEARNIYARPDDETCPPIPCQGDRCAWWVRGNADLGLPDRCGVTIVPPDPLDIGEDDDPFLLADEGDDPDLRLEGE